MQNARLVDAFVGLSTPLVADACLRLGVPLRLAPAGIRSIVPGQRLAGGARPVRHYGSVDLFLEAIGMAEPGDVLVIDNAGRADEACIGDLTVLEAQAGGLAGVVVWGLHRDTVDLERIGVPVFSYGACPAGPQRLDPPEAEALRTARFDDIVVSGEDVVFADSDGVLFVPGAQAEALLATARSLWQTERAQAEAVRAGRTLREQLRFDEYLTARASDPSYTFRKHLRALGGAIEE